MGVQNVAAQLLIDGVYTAKSVYVDEGMTLQVGPDPDTGTTPSEATVTFANPDLSIDPSNVLSPLYGKIGRYTPVKLLIGGATVAFLEAADWAPDRTLGHRVSPARGRSWTTLNAKGILDRLQLWKEPLRSPMFYEISSYATSLGYWTGEGDGAALNNETAGPAGSFAGSVSFGQNDGPSGSDKTLQLGSDGQISGKFLRASGNGYQVCWAMQLPNALTATNLTVFSFTTTDGIRFEWQTSNTQFTFNMIATDGTVLGTLGSLFGGVSPLSWMRCRVRVTVSAGTVTVEPAWYAQDAAAILGVTFTYSAAGTGRPDRWSVTPNTYTNSASYSHIFAVTDTTLDLAGSYNATQVFNGYNGEGAFDRASRLLSGVGVGLFIVGQLSDCIKMGPQKPGLIYDLVDQCVVTDGGLIWDSTGSLSLTMRTGKSRFAQTSKMDLTYGVNVAPPLQKKIGPVGVANRVTVTNQSGATATVVRSTGTMSIQPPPAGIGEVRGQVDVNMQYDAALDDRAAWELALGTLDRPRYQSVTIDLVRNPELLTARNSLRPGDLITLSGVEPEPIRLHVIQFREVVGSGTRLFTMRCIPGEPYDGGIYGTSRYSVRSSSTNASMTTTATSLAVKLTNPLDYWSQTATGYDLLIAGERMTVTGAFSAPVALVQTATVTRSVNGVVRTHVSGEPVTLATNPGRYAYTNKTSGGISMVAGGDVIAAGDINRVRPTMLKQEASSALPASSSTVAVSGISITFTTAAAGAQLTLWWFIRADPTAAATGLISARPLVTGPSAFSQNTTNFALSGGGPAASDVMTPGNTDTMTLGAAGNYTVTLIGTTSTNEQIGLYSAVTVMVQEVAP